MAGKIKMTKSKKSEKKKAGKKKSKDKKPSCQHFCPDCSACCAGAGEIKGR